MKSYFYVTNDPERALGLESNLKNFHIICIDRSSISDQLESKGVKIFCLEKELNEANPIYRNSNKLLTHPLVLDYIKRNSDSPEDTYIWVFKIAPNIERSLSRFHFKSLNTSSQMNRKYEGKISQYEFLKSLSVSMPKTKTGRLNELATYSAEVGYPFVVQYDRGHTGDGTIFINSTAQLQTLSKEFPKRPVRISEYIEGESWTINCALSEAGLAFGGLSKQLTGIKELTDKKGATVGNDWTLTKFLSKDIAKQIEDITKNVGTAMEKDGYMGMFGLDFQIAADGVVYLIEINARQPASTGVHTKLMLEDSDVPLSLLHIAQFATEDSNSFTRFINDTLNRSFTIESLREQIKTQNSQMHKGYEASQFLIRNNEKNQVLLLRSIKSGIYRDKVFTRKGCSITDIKSDCEFLLNVASKNRLISQGGEIARVVSRKSVLDSRAKLREIYIKQINSVRDNIVQIEIHTLPDDVVDYIDQYTNLQIADKKVRAPYYRNVKRVRAGLRALLGKGTPTEIEEESLIYAKLRSFALSESDPSQIREFMESQGIGIDCSGFVSHIYTFWLSKRGHGRLDNHLKFPKESLKRKLIRKLRYIENISADLLTSKENTKPITINQVKPGDLLRLRGAKRGDHIAMVYLVKKTGEYTSSFTYVHSSPYYHKDNGVKFGEVLITDPKKGLREQDWKEVDTQTGENFTYEGLLREYKDNGLRRANFSELLT